MRDFKAFVREHLSSLVLPVDRELKVVDEIAAQLEDSYESALARGLSDEEAWQVVRRQIPDWTGIAQDILSAEPAVVRLAQPTPGRGPGMVARTLNGVRDLIGVGLLRDLRASVRLLVKDRGFTLTTLLTLAICLGANAATFTMVYSVLLRPLPVPDARRIVAMGDVYPTITPDDILSNDAPSYFDRREAITALEEQALFSMWYDSLTINGVSEELRGMRATPSLLRVLRVEPALGRAFTEAEGQLGADQKIILSHGLWQRLHGGDPSVIGRDVRLGWTGQPYTIVGVMPRGFKFFEMGDDGHARVEGEQIAFWLPLTFTDAQRADSARTRYGFYHIGRLRPGATIDQVRSQLDRLNADNAARFPQFRYRELKMYTAVTPLQDALTRHVRRILYLLWGGATFVLLIGVLNIANLSLARASVRAREFATRVALGAGRLRMIRQLVLEGVLLAVAGGLAGVGVGTWLLKLVAASGLAHVPNAGTVRLDWTIGTSIVAASALLGVVMGLVPAANAIRPDIARALTERSRLGTGGRAARLFRRGLVVAQVACSVMLLIGAALLLASFRNLLAIDAGFDRERVVTATIFPPPSRYPDAAAVVAVSNRVVESARSIPGVIAAGLTSNIALSGGTSPALVTPAGERTNADGPPVLPSVVSVSPGYFAAMGTRFVSGRDFADADVRESQLVAVVDERLASRFWPGQDPIGKGIQRGNAPPAFTVVGVVRPVRFSGLAAPNVSAGAAYFSHTQTPIPGRLRYIAIKTAADPTSVIPALRAALKAIDPELPLADVQTMTERTTQSLVTQRLSMGLAGLFGVVALFLSALGIYGVLAYLVSQKTREIGIRMALGSTARKVFQLFFTEGVMLVTAGLTFGVVGALLVGRLLEDQVFGVRPTDPMILGLVAFSTGLVALLACVSPARRATRVDPIRVLNEP
jgi:putative ABC transport system permease protein